MTLELFLSLWGLIGLISVATIFKYDSNKGLDITLGDIILGLLFALVGGPLTAIIITVYIIEDGGFDKVIIKGKNKKRAGF